MGRRPKQEKKAPKLQKEKIKTFQLLRGMKDILPSEQKYWHQIRILGEKIAYDYGFKRIDSPILEELGLFIRSIGKETDIVQKELFSFIDQGGDKIGLRPEFTAGLARAYIEHGMFNLPQPVKLYTNGPVFRHERPQSGRARQFHQLNFEVLGDDQPVIDAQLILLAYSFFKELGLETKVEINSIGCPECRENYRETLVSYLRSKRSQLCETCKKRISHNPLRVFDCKEQKCQSVKEEAPQIIDWLCDDCKNHFMRVLEYLDELEVLYEPNPYLVRGLDYYTRTVFEVFTKNSINKSAQESIAAGGRYDNLIEFLGGRPTPASGMAIGIERSILKMKEAKVEPAEVPAPQIFLAQLGEKAKIKALSLFEALRREGIPVTENLSKSSLRAQLDIANKLGVKLTLILGQKEVSDGMILIRDMESGIQEEVDYNKVIKEIKKKIL
ncbi:MAG: histidine--tRNA ligase [bacterium]